MGKMCLLFSLPVKHRMKRTLICHTFSLSSPHLLPYTVFLQPPSLPLPKPPLLPLPPSRLVVKQSPCRPAFPAGALMALLRHSDKHKHSTTKVTKCSSFHVTGFTRCSVPADTQALLLMCVSLWKTPFISQYQQLIYGLLLLLLLLMLLLRYIQATSWCFHHLYQFLQNSSSAH